MSGKEFELQDEVYILEPEEDGDSFKSFALIEGDSEEESWQYIDFRTGEVEEQETASGDTTLIKNLEDHQSLGNVEYIETVRDALDELIDRNDLSD
jgi:hypothetical protein